MIESRKMRDYCNKSCFGRCHTSKSANLMVEVNHSGNTFVTVNAVASAAAVVVKQICEAKKRRRLSPCVIGRNRLLDPGLIRCYFQEWWC